VQLLSSPQRLQLAGIATQLRLPARKILYREASMADWIFIIADGVAKAFRELPSGKRRIMTFLFADDVLGLAECGRYVDTVQTVTPVTLYRIRLDLLLEMLRQDSTFQLQFLSKVAHELRRSLQQTIVLSRRDAVGRVAMFLHMLDQHGRQQDGASQIEIPMSRSDIANFLGLSLGAVIRASRRLEQSGLVAFDGLHAARILNRRRFEDLATGV
jgi:CRP-like cAMP-binding protein